MPMIDVTILAESLDARRKTALLARLTQVLLKWEGVPADSPTVAFAWAYLHEVARGAYTLGGQVPEAGREPHYRIVATVPQYVLDNERKAGLIDELTRTAIEIEGSAWSDQARYRVTCYVLEVPDGGYGVGGAVFRPQARGD